MTKNEQLLKRVEKDLSEIEKEYCAKTPLEIFNNAYEIATFCEFADAITFVCEDEDASERFDDIDTLINYNGNLLKYLKDGWRNFKHPEMYAFFTTYESAIEIINEITSWAKREKHIFGGKN